MLDTILLVVGATGNQDVDNILDVFYVATHFFAIFKVTFDYLHSIIRPSKQAKQTVSLSKYRSPVHTRPPTFG